MDTKEIISQQIKLLAQINNQLAGQVTVETAREIRENALAILQLSKAAEAESSQELELRINRIESSIFGDGESNKGLIKIIKGLDVNQEDHEDRILAIEARVDPDAWDMLESEDELPDDFTYDETLGGLLKRVEKLEAGE